MTLSQVSKQKWLIIMTIVDRMSDYERRDFLAYRRAPGFRIATIDSHEVCRQAWKGGWLEPEPIIHPEGIKPVYLTREAWERFSTSEQAEIEEAELIKQRGEHYGSW